jgi:hypothetical protein
MKIKYIYFEVTTTTHGEEGKDDIVNTYITNQNIVLIKPWTNSNGVSGCLHVTNHNCTVGRMKTYTNRVYQNWIDLDKYEFGRNKHTHIIEQDKNIREVLETVTKQLKEA